MPGIGVGFIPEVLNSSIVDESYAALSMASREDAAGKTIVVLLPDRAEHYVTTALFADG
jgi:cysteine synthase